MCLTLAILPTRIEADTPWALYLCKDGLPHLPIMTTDQEASIAAFYQQCVKTQLSLGIDALILPHDFRRLLHVALAGINTEDPSAGDEYPPEFIVRVAGGNDLRFPAGLLDGTGCQKPYVRVTAPWGGTLGCFELEPGEVPGMTEILRLVFLGHDGTPRAAPHARLGTSGDPPDPEVIQEAVLAIETVRGNV